RRRSSTGRSRASCSASSPEPGCRRRPLGARVGADPRRARLGARAARSARPAARRAARMAPARSARRPAPEGAPVPVRPGSGRPGWRVLGGRGSRGPAFVWQGSLDDRWSLVVQEHVDAEPLRTLDARVLDDLLVLVELQAALDVPAGGWDVGEWIALVLFEGW